LPKVELPLPARSLSLSLSLVFLASGPPTSTSGRGLPDFSSKNRQQHVKVAEIRVAQSGNPDQDQLPKASIPEKPTFFRVLW